MNISLTKQLEEFVARQVKSGRYSSASEVVRQGLRLLQGRDRAEESKLQALRAAIKEGLASGPATPLDMEQIISSASRKHAARHTG